MVLNRGTSTNQFRVGNREPLQVLEQWPIVMKLELRFTMVLSSPSGDLRWKHPVPLGRLPRHTEWVWPYFNFQQVNSSDPKSPTLE